MISYTLINPYRRMEVKLLAIVGNYYRPTDGSYDRRIDRVKGSFTSIKKF